MPGPARKTEPMPPSSAALLAAFPPGLAIWFWDSFENTFGLDGPDGLYAWLALFAAAWLVAFVILDRATGEPRRAGWMLGCTVALVAVGALARIALDFDEGAFLVFLAGAPVVVVSMALGVACGLVAEWLGRRRTRASPTP